MATALSDLTVEHKVQLRWGRRRGKEKKNCPLNWVSTSNIQQHLKDPKSLSGNQCVWFSFSIYSGQKIFLFSKHKLTILSAINRKTFDRPFGSRKHVYRLVLKRSMRTHPIKRELFCGDDVVAMSIFIILIYLARESGRSGKLNYQFETVLSIIFSSLFSNEIIDTAISVVRKPSSFWWWWQRRI